ncbi:MAG: divalent-cation tolerance protein CutA [Deltaproteobacteria bacterium]|nr:divalent-cation tolerance protein CutA [Deltaproteobacteria bacterium]
MTQCIQVTTTVANQEDADTLTRLVLEKRLAACVQITSCRSSYHWQGAIEQDDELKLVMKSFVQLYPQLEQCILDHHPYDIPEILATPVQFCNSGYLDWLASELKQE